MEKTNRLAAHKANTMQPDNARPEKMLALGWAVSGEMSLSALAHPQNPKIRVGTPRSRLWKRAEAIFIHLRQSSGQTVCTKLKQMECFRSSDQLKFLTPNFKEDIYGRWWRAWGNAWRQRATHRSWPRPSRRRSRGPRRTPTAWRCSALWSCIETGTASKCSRLETWREGDHVIKTLRSSVDKPQNNRITFSLSFRSDFRATLRNPTVCRGFILLRHFLKE